MHRGRGYTEFVEFRAAHQVTATGEVAKVETASSNKEQYLRNKQQAAEARKKEARLRKLREECERIEARLEEIDTLMFGEAATDYKKAAALEEEKNTLEERLLEIYEEIGV